MTTFSRKHSVKAKIKRRMAAKTTRKSQRTHKGAQDRFKVTGTGKLLCGQKGGRRHGLSRVRGPVRRRKRLMKVVTDKMENKVKKMLRLA